MRRAACVQCALAAAAALLIVYSCWARGGGGGGLAVDGGRGAPSGARSARRDDMVLAVVACGDRLQETLNMLKSAVMFTAQPFLFVVVTEEALAAAFERRLAQWRAATAGAFSYRIVPLTFPADASGEWRRLFKPCAAQRLFLPTVLTDVDAVLYVDTDTLFLAGLRTVWQHFGHMNTSQMAALAPEHEDPNVGWYNRFARHPFYGALGVNSGVMLMNLTRMRQFHWAEYVVPVYRRYKPRLTWGDQDIINIIFHFHPDKLYLYPCRYNFRPDHCMYTSVCRSAEREGVAVLHGSRGFFHSARQPAFQAVYRAFDEYQLDADPRRHFLQPLHRYLHAAADSNCGRVRHVFTDQLDRRLTWQPPA